MKKIKLIALSLTAFLAVNANALNLDEAVNIALKNNFDIQGKNYDYLESLENVKVNRAGFLPKLDTAYTYTNTDEANSGFESDDGVASVTLSYNLFNGFKDMALKDSANYLSESSQYSLDATKQDIVLETKTAYINYLDKLNALETYKSAYSLFQEQYENSKNKFEQGLIAKNDLLQVQVIMSNSKQNVVKAQGDLKVAKHKLSNILGGIDLSNEKIENLDEKSLVASNYDEKQLENRSEIQALSMNLKSIRELEKSANAGYYPKINASVSHNEYYDGFTNDRPQNKEDNQNIAKVSATWNLYNGGADLAQSEMYKKRYLSVNSLLNKTIHEINLQFENAKSNLEVATDNLETSRLALLQAQENYEIVKNRFNEGISTTTDLTDANYLLTQAKQGYNRAYFDKYLAISTLDRIFEINKY